jgi:hypothetical protein
MAGYSGTPLAKKLGIKPGHDVVLLNAPEDFTLEAEGAKLTRAMPKGTKPNVILSFVRSLSELKKSLSGTAKKLDPDGGLWVAWPKKASKVKTDVTEDLVREAALEIGLVDNKVCAIDETWSGLRLVYRVEDRPRLRKK